MLCEFSKVSLLQSIPIRCFQDGEKEISHFRNERTELIIEWRFPEIFVQIPDKMNQAFLLSTVYSVIAAIEDNASPFL